MLGTISKEIKELNITQPEETRYQSYLLQLRESGYMLEQVSLVEFVIEERLRQLNKPDQDSSPKKPDKD